MCKLYKLVALVAWEVKVESLVRTHSMQGGREGNPYVNQASFSSQPRSPFSAAPTASLYPQIHSNQGQEAVEAQQQGGNPYIVMGGEGEGEGEGSGNPHAQRAAGAVEEHLVTIPGAIVHLVDDQESVFLGNGDFSVVRITQQSRGIVALVRVGDALQWPLMSDEQVVKLDPIHYVFSLPVAPTLDRVAVGKSAAAEVCMRSQFLSPAWFSCLLVLLEPHEFSYGCAEEGVNTILLTYVLVFHRNLCLFLFVAEPRDGYFYQMR